MLEEMMSLVKIKAGKVQAKQKRLYDRTASPRTLTVGDQVLVLLPNLRKVTPMDYEIEMTGHRKEKRVYHVNILKKYYGPELSTTTS